MSIVADRPATKIPPDMVVDPVGRRSSSRSRRSGSSTSRGVCSVHGHDSGRRATLNRGDSRRLDHHDVRRARDTICSRRLLDTARYPELRFESKSVEADGDELVARRPDDQGCHEARRLRGHFLGTGPTRWERANRGELSGTIDRTGYGLSGNCNSQAAASCCRTRLS